FDQVFDDPWHRAKPGDALPVKKLAFPEGFPLCRLENVRTGKRPPLNPREFDWGPFDKADLEMGDGRMVAWAKRFLRQRHDKPFFLATGVFRPHLPWYAPREYFELYPLDEIALPEVPPDDLADVPPAGRKIAEYRGDEWKYVRDQQRWREAVQAYLASISFADALVGQLLRALDESPYAENTIVVLWSDHGWHLGEKHHWHKFTLWEEATRVPLIIAAPGVTTRGSRTSQPVGLIDLYPTLVDLCDLPANNRLDGVSLSGLLSDSSAKSQRPALTSHGRGSHAVRSQRYRFIRYADGSEELYDHRNDPHEWTNLANRAEHAELKRELAGWIPKEEAKPAPTKRAYEFDPIRYVWRRKGPSK
ncbi:MAG: sulfatase, partial [Pirellulaceae bacterium]|nr:sulfatase [Pirellulaceae bacterium]